MVLTLFLCSLSLATGFWKVSSVKFHPPAPLSLPHIQPANQTNPLLLAM